MKKQKICHDDSCPPYDSFCTYCSRSGGCDSEDFRIVSDNEPDSIHIDGIKRENELKEYAKKEAIAFAEWMLGKWKHGYNFLWEEVRDDFEIPQIKTTSEVYKIYLQSIK